MFKGSVDPFAVKHMGPVYEILHSGHTTPFTEEQIPGYYTAVAVVSLVLGISPDNIPFEPLFVLTFISISFMALHTVSNSTWIGVLLTVPLVTAGIQGTGKLYLWPHGIGTMLTFTVMIVCYHLLLARSDKRRFFPLMILVIATISVSYNSTLRGSLFLFLLMTIHYIQHRYISTEKLTDLNLQKTILAVLFFGGIVLFGLSRFVYEIFVPMIVRFSGDSGPVIPSVEKFTQLWFGGDKAVSALESLLISYPPSITYLNLARYLIIAAALAVVGFSALDRWRHRDPLTRAHLVVFCYAGAIALFMLPRLALGDMPFAAIFLPGLFALGYLARAETFPTNVTIAAILIVALVTPLTFVEHKRHDITNHDESEFAYMSNVGKWYLEYGEEERLFSDELSRGFILVEGLKQEPEQRTYRGQNYRINAIPHQEAAALVEQRRPEGGYEAQYYMFNYNLNRMSLQNWFIIGSWDNEKRTIEANNNMNNVYDGANIDIYWVNEKEQLT